MVIILTRGIQGSGKSTWAKNWVKEDPTHRVRWNNDDIRNMFGEYWVPKRENTKALNIMKDAFITRFMQCGYDIVIDDMNLNLKTVDQIRDLMECQNKLIPTSYKLEFKDFFIPVEECIERDKLRTHPIGEKVIKDTWRRYKSEIIRIKQKEYYNQFNNYDINKLNCIVVDLDGTTALSLSGRPFFGEGCAEQIKYDVPITPTIHIVENFLGTVIFLTGRNEDCRNATIDWIDNNFHLPNGFILHMKDNKDYTSGTEFKMNVINKEILPYYNIEFILEDSDKVVKTMRDNNLFVLQPIKGLN